MTLLLKEEADLVAAAEVAADGAEGEAVGAEGVAKDQVGVRDPAKDHLVGTNHQKVGRLKVLLENIGKRQSRLGRVLLSATKLENWYIGMI